MNTEINQRKGSFRLLFIVTLLLSGLFAFVNLSEFTVVGVMKHTDDYPFGGEGPTPWHYKSAQVYAVVHLSFGVLFLLDFFMSVWSFFKARRNILLVSFGVTLFLIALQLLTA
jgi:hypothetical protein